MLEDRQKNTYKPEYATHMSKLSFQYGFNVFLITLVVWVCSASTVMTAKGSGSRKTSRLDKPSAATTVGSVRARVHTSRGRDWPVILIFLLLRDKHTEQASQTCCTYGVPCEADIGRGGMSLTCESLEGRVKRTKRRGEAEDGKRR